MSRDRVSLSQILERIDLALEFAGREKAQFMSSRIAQEAVIRELEVIGEATKRISPGTKARAGDVPWRSMTGFKNVAVHQYDAVDLERVWEMVSVDLPRIRGLVRSALQDFPES